MHYSKGDDMRKVEVEKVHRMKGERTFHYIALTVISLLAIYCIIPFILMVAISFSSEESLTLSGYRFWPGEISFAASRCGGRYSRRYTYEPGDYVYVRLSAEPAGLQTEKRFCFHPVLYDVV